MSKRTISEMPWTSVQEAITLPTTTGRKVKVDHIDFRVEEMIQDKFIVPKMAMKFFVLLPGTGTYMNQYGEMAESPTEGVPILPEDWWKYAYCTYQGKNVKAGMRPRTEQDEKSQEELDRDGESLGEAIDRVFKRS